VGEETRGFFVLFSFLNRSFFFFLFICLLFGANGSETRRTVSGNKS
jgi:hypothetical protein